MYEHTTPWLEECSEERLCQVSETDPFKKKRRSEEEPVPDDTTSGEAKKKTTAKKRVKVSG